MRIAITGATGFVGINLAHEFHDDGLGVVATGRSRTIGEKLQAGGIAFKTADLQDPKSLQSAFAKADCVVHCAANAGWGGTFDAFHEPNVIGTRHVIQACLKEGITKIIFISTPSVYFNMKDRFNISESEPLPKKQLTFYAQTKLLAEQELRDRQREGLYSIILRPRAVFGPHDRTILPHVLRLSEKKKFPLINGGKALVDITSVANLVDAVRACLQAPQDAWNETYNISNGDPLRMRDWFASILKALDRPFRPKPVPVPVAMLAARWMELRARLSRSAKAPTLTRFTVGYMARSMTLSLDKAKAKLGYAPRVGNREGLERYADWYRSEKGSGY